MKNFKKGFVIVILALALGVILYFRQIIFLGTDKPRMVDRLPSADFIAKSSFLDLAKELDVILFKYKLPIREFTSHDFLLSQGKNSGVDVQKPVYLFASAEESEWGAMIHVTDSAKIIDAIERFRKNTVVLDSSQNGIRVFHLTELNLAICYEKTYLLLYSGSKLNSKLAEIHDAQLGTIRPMWKSFLALNVFKKEKLVVYSTWKGFKEAGIDYALFSHDNDTTQVNVKYYLHSNKGFGIKRKDEGFGLPFSEFDSKSIELHVDKKTFKEQSQDELRSKLIQLGRRIGFPTNDFLNAWEGDLSFREGGLVKSTQKIIVSEIDEDFNVHEVTKLQETFVPGYSIAFSTNDKGPIFIQNLFRKGILHQEEGKMRFLFSPLLSMKKWNGYYIFTSSALIPTLENTKTNSLHWNYKGTPYSLKMDDVSKNVIQGNIEFPVKRLIQYIKTSSRKKTK